MKMFDVTNIRGGNTSVTFNSVAGTIVKSCPESKFVRFQGKSPMSETYFNEAKPHRRVNYTQIPIAVLQVMLCADNWMLVEFVDIKESE
jgi:hypothetical protein